MQSIYGSNNLVAMELTTVLYIKKKGHKEEKTKESVHLCQMKKDVGYLLTSEGVVSSIVVKSLTSFPMK